MARIYYIKKSRTEHTCTTARAASHTIPVGEPYSYAMPGFRGAKKYRCAAHPFRTSELMTGLAAGPQAAQESFEDQCDAGFESVDDLSSAWDDLKSEAESYLDERESALDAWENGNSTLEELRDRAQEAVDALEEFEPEDFSDDEPERDSYDEGEHGDEEFERDHEEWESERDEHMDTQIEAARDALGNVEW